MSKIELQQMHVNCFLMIKYEDLCGNEMFKHENSIKLQKEKRKVNKQVQTVVLVNIGCTFNFFFFMQKQ